MSQVSSGSNAVLELDPESKLDKDLDMTIMSSSIKSFGAASAAPSAASATSNLEELDRTVGSVAPLDSVGESKEPKSEPITKPDTVDSDKKSLDSDTAAAPVTTDTTAKPVTAPQAFSKFIASRLGAIPKPTMKSPGLSLQEALANAAARFDNDGMAISGDRNSAGSTSGELNSARDGGPGLTEVTDSVLLKYYINKFAPKTEKFLRLAKKQQS